MIVSAVRRGDASAAKAVYEVFNRGLRYYFCREVGPNDAEDLVQRTVLVVLDAIRQDRIVQVDRLPAYIRGVAINLVRGAIDDRIKRRSREVELAGFMSYDHKPTIEDHLLRVERVAIVKRCLEKLPLKDREILIRFYLHEQTKEEICAEMRLTSTQFRLRKSRAKAKLTEACRQLTRRRPFAHKVLSADRTPHNGVTPD